MKVLLAHSDRDLLSSLSGLWRLEGLEAETAFDGTMVPPLLARGPYGAAVLDEALPRMSHASLMALLRREGIPVIVLTGERVTVKRLLAPDLANAYLSFPFLPCELRALIDDVRAKADSKEILRCGDVAVQVAAFRFEGTDVRLTAGETDLLKALIEGRPVRSRGARIPASALNRKLSLLDKALRIEYEPNDGYRLVNAHD